MSRKWGEGMAVDTSYSGCQAMVFSFTIKGKRARQGMCT